MQALFSSSFNDELAFGLRHEPKSFQSISQQNSILVFLALSPCLTGDLRLSEVNFIGINNEEKMEEFVKPHVLSRSSSINLPARRPGVNMIIRSCSLFFFLFLSISLYGMMINKIFGAEFRCISGYH